MNSIKAITEDIFFVKKYILFFTYFMYLYPLGNNNTFLVNSIGECKCGNTKRMLLYLFGSREKNKKYIRNTSDLNFFGKSVTSFIEKKRIEAQKLNKHLMVDISLGAIDHTFVLNFLGNDVYIYQSYIKINPIVITKLSDDEYKCLLYVIDRLSIMSSDIDKICIDNKIMSIMVLLFGVYHYDIKYLFDNKFSIDWIFYDRTDFYMNVIDICNLYHDKFIKKGTYITYDYKKKTKWDREDKYYYSFYGNVLINEYKMMISELSKNVRNENIDNLVKILDKN